MVVLNDSLSLNLLALATLDATGAVFTKFDTSREQGFKFSKMKTAILLSGKTAGEGPISYGFAINDAAETEEAIEADPQRSRDPGESEKANRRVYPVGIIPISATGMQVLLDPDSIMNLKTLRDWPQWSIIEGEALEFWAYNHGSTLTTGANLFIKVLAIGKWLRD